MGRDGKDVVSTYIERDFKMAGNTRGKIKEHLEGVHRNCDWSKHHLQTVLNLCEDKNPKISDQIELLAKSIDEVDKFNQLIYANI